MSLTQVTTGGVDENINIDSNTLKVDGTNNRVGMGTEAPQTTLHVKNTTEGDAYFKANSGDGGADRGLVIKSGTGQYTGSKHIFNALSSGGQLEFQTAGSPALFIDQSQRIGIGTTAPNNMLHLNGASPAIRLSDTGANGSAFSIIEDNDGLLKVRNDVGNAGAGSGIAVEVDASEAVRIDSVGRTGIGTQGPQLKLHVQDGALASAPTPNSNCDVVIEGTTNTGIQFLSGGQAQIRFGDAASTGAGSVIYNHSDNLFKLNYNNSGALTFNNGSGEVGRFDGSGRLLVGLNSFPDTDAFVVRGGAGEDHEAFMSLVRGSVPANNQNLGMIRFHGNGNQTEAARITALRDGGTWTAGSSHPGRLVFSTVRDGSTSPREHFRLSASGRLSGNAIAIERVFSMLYSRLVSHSGCSSNGPSATFTNFDDSEPAFKVVGRTVTAAPTNYRFIGNDSGEAFSFFVSCGDQVAFATHNASADAPTYRSWVCCHEDFLNALAGLPNNSTRTSLP